MNVIMTIDPEQALNGEFAQDLDHPGWVQGWGVIKGPPHDREFAGLFASRAAADAAAAGAGAGFEARWGSYSPEERDFVTGDTDDPVC
jgi:hypothetical protein